MMDNQDQNIKKILSNAVNAPSGDNTQPWFFSIKGNLVEIYCDEELYKNNIYDKYDIYISYGALIENIEIVANYYKYSIDISLFPKSDNNLYIANIFFKKNEQISSEENEILFYAIKNRFTNRSPYEIEQISTSFKNKVNNIIINNSNDLSIAYIEDKKSISNIAHFVSLQIRMMFSNKVIHNSFFGNIRWGRKDKIIQDGIDIEELHLKFYWQKFIFYFLLKNGGSQKFSVG